jgi:hypothetical protein
VIEGGGLRLKTKRSLRPRVSIGIILEDKLNSQMPSAVEATEGNAKKASGERRIAVSKFVRPAVIVRARKAVQLGRKFGEFFDASVNPS